MSYEDKQFVWVLVLLILTIVWAPNARWIRQTLTRTLQRINRLLDVDEH